MSTKALLKSTSDVKGNKPKNTIAIGLMNAPHVMMLTFSVNRTHDAFLNSIDRP